MYIALKRRSKQKFEHYIVENREKKTTGKEAKKKQSATKIDSCS